MPGIKKTLRGIIPIELRPRLCLLQKLPDSPGFGFNLHTSFGRHIWTGICHVDPNSPADRAGLLSGDRIVRLNGAKISEDPHTLVARYIKESGDCVSLVVVSPEGYTFFKDRWVTPERDYYQYAVCTNPLLQVLHLVKPTGSVGYGLSLRHRTDRNVWVGEVEVNSPADTAGVKPGDQILEVNGVNLRGQSRDVVVKKMKMKKNNEVYMTVWTEGREVISSEVLRINNNTPDVPPREENFTNKEDPAEPATDPISIANPGLPRDDVETFPKSLLFPNEQENEPETPHSLRLRRFGSEEARSSWSPVYRAMNISPGLVHTRYPGSAIAEWDEEIRARTERERREKQDEDERRKILCVVCKDREKNYTLIPCGHMACCSICADRLEICPVCRARVTSSVKTFIP